MSDTEAKILTNIFRGVISSSYILLLFGGALYMDCKPVRRWMRAAWYWHVGDLDVEG